MLTKVQSLILVFCFCGSALFGQEAVNFKTSETIVCGAERIDQYRYYLEENRVAVVANPTSEVKGLHLVDFLLQEEIDVVKVFAPEHGFRGTADAGAKIEDGRDSKTGLKIISLYGKNKKPKYDHLADVDVVVFDIQDVGVRFYTYISTMHYVMQACAEMDKKVVVLDRPNPNGHYVDGPILDLEFQSFVGMHPVPLVHGMTIAEYAQMINGEGWLGEGLKCDLEVVPCLNYDHNDFYKLPIKPSPNLPNMSSIFLYPSLALFEGTIVSIGRGTPFPFQVFGHPDYQEGDFLFTPVPGPGAKYPKLNGKECRGVDLKSYGLSEAPRAAQINLAWIIDAHKELTENGHEFFLENHFIDLLYGSDQLRGMLQNETAEAEIRATWEEGLKEFKAKREKYLLYEDF